MSDPERRSYRLLMWSPLGVVREGDTQLTLDIWQRDLVMQLRVCVSMCVVCPVTSQRPSGAYLLPLPAEIETFPTSNVLDLGALRALVRRHDVVQVAHGYLLFSRAFVANFLLAVFGRLEGKLVIFGTSSHRVRTALIDGREKGRLRSRVRSWFTAASIYASQRIMMALAHAVFIVGHGLRVMVPRARLRTMHVSVASWIEEPDIMAEREALARVAAWEPGRVYRLCVTSRLVAIKAVHIAIEAAAMLRQQQDLRFELVVYGVGVEEKRLRALVEKLGAGEYVRFGGLLEYPEPFLSTLRDYDFIVMPNINDEQPRALFDAISNGLVPICSDLAQFRELGLPPELLFRAGDPAALCACVLAAVRRGDREAMMKRVLTVAHEYTLTNMHSKRAAWIDGLRATFAR